MCTVKEKVVEKIIDSKIVVILRGLNTEELVNTVRAIRAGGITCCEVTYDSSGRTSDEQTAKNIATLVKEFPDTCVGAGTVLSEKQVELTAYAGGKFIISPDTNPDVIKKTVRMGLVSIPGALTPSEAATAVRSGADFVKLFPVGELGSSYLKAVATPLSHIRFLAVGGVNEKNASEYLSAGACGIGVATAIVNKTLIKEGRFNEITELAKKYVRAVKGE